MISPELLNRIEESNRPIVYFGNGCRNASWLDGLVTFLEGASVPYIVNCHAHGIVKSQSKMFLGNYGYGANGFASSFIAEYQPDLIVFLGSRLGEVVTSGWSDQLKLIPQKIHVDRKESALNRYLTVEFPVSMDLTHFSEFLLSIQFSAVLERQKKIEQIFEKTDLPEKFVTDEAKGVHPGKFLQILSTVLPSDAIVFTDIGNSTMWTIGNLSIRDQQDFFSPLGLASMGSGFCGAIGAKAANPSRTVCAVVGDAAMMMHGNELLSAKINSLSVKVIVLNDGGHGMVHHGQEMIKLPVKARFGEKVDFGKWAAGLGIESQRIEKSEELLESRFSMNLKSEVPFLFELMVDDMIVPPVGNRAKMFQGARDKNI